MVTVAVTKVAVVPVAVGQAEGAMEGVAPEGAEMAAVVQEVAVREGAAKVGEVLGGVVKVVGEAGVVVVASGAEVRRGQSYHQTACPHRQWLCQHL